MKHRYPLAALAATCCMALAAMAQAAGPSTTTNSTDRRITTQSSSEHSTQADSGAHERRAIREKRTPAQWAAAYAREHDGRVSRQAFMNEMGRRWQTHDPNGQGLTPDELRRL